MDAKEGKIGEEGKYTMQYADGMVKIEIGYKGSQAEAGMYTKIQVVDMIQALIDSTDTKLDNTLLDPVLEALRKK